MRLQSFLPPNIEVLVIVRQHGHTIMELMEDLVPGLPPLLKRIHLQGSFENVGDDEISCHQTFASLCTHGGVGFFMIKTSRNKQGPLPPVLRRCESAEDMDERLWGVPEKSRIFPLAQHASSEALVRQVEGLLSGATEQSGRLGES